MIYVVVDEDLCTGCGMCVTYCPYKGAEVVDGRVEFLEACLHCTACVAVCPEYALSLENRPTKRDEPRDPVWRPPAARGRRPSGAQGP